MGLIAIGDIHGCLKTLEVLLEQLAPTDGDHLVFVGDYVDRGPDSKGVIDYLLKLRQSVRCTFLRGNHEALFLGYLDEAAYDIWAINGGIATLNSYMQSGEEVEIPESHIAFLRETIFYYETEEFFFVHAGLKPDLTIAQNIEVGSEDVFLWERSHLKVVDLPWEKTVVCGHTPQPEPTDREKLINIDTGCVFYTHPRMGFLTAVHLPAREYVSIPYRG